MKKIFILLISIILMLPIYFMLTGSLQDIRGVMKMPPDLIPNAMTLFNYRKIFSLDCIRWLSNTVMITSIGLVASVFTSCSAGYVFAFYKFRMKEILWQLFLIGMMIPRIALIIPLYVIFSKLKLSGTFAAVIFPTILSPVSLYLARIYFESVPISLLESARLDGASELQILSRIVAPVSVPIIAALSIFSSVFSLQDFLWQSLVLQIEDRQTLLVGLMRFANERGGIVDASINPLGRSLAVGMVLLIPLLLIFIVANKYFVGSMEGAVKE